MLLKLLVADYHSSNYDHPHLPLKAFFFSSVAIINLNNCEILEEAVKIKCNTQKKFKSQDISSLHLENSV